MADLDISSLYCICSKSVDDNLNFIQVSDKAVDTLLQSCNYRRDSSVRVNIRLASPLLIVFMFIQNVVKYSEKEKT